VARLAQRRERFGAAHVIEILRGSRSERVVSRNHDELSVHGIGKDHTLEEWRALVRALLHQGLVSETQDGYPVLCLNAESWQVLKGERAVKVARMAKIAAAPRKDRTASDASLGGEDKALFDAVRRWGGRVRHPTDVRVFTSPRLNGRARDGAADTLARWGSQGEDDPILGLESLNTVIGAVPMVEPELTFATLAAETAKLRRLARLHRRRAAACEAPAAPDAEASRGRTSTVQALMRRA